MKILSWNCSGAFRKKYKFINKFEADILIIQECENPLEVDYEKELFDEYPFYIWTGDNKNKGLGLFSKYKLKDNEWKNQNTKYFISCDVNNAFNLLGVWCHQANSPTFQYIGQLWKYLMINKNKIRSRDIIIGGDLNSNSIWDVWDRWWNHSDVVKELKNLNIKSLYHHFYKEKQGEEHIPTFYHTKNNDKGYHIDYFFASSKFAKNIKDFCIEEFSEWKQFSDHIPIIVEISEFDL